ncbi:hypothetical protein Prudu_006759 [Prunus dulcis]|uniref:Uncharacterized protein n=1 Tax=Prunus dulcis TaxID=3755 RepID=A0A4Y1R0H0_PRUDU|nr:hypothetical protein Prudu_006759 [Prunus dulcis]
MKNLGIPLALLRRARRKESVDTEWGRIGVVTKSYGQKSLSGITVNISKLHLYKPRLCAKRAADFQRVMAPPPSSNGHGTGGVGTAIESPTFSNRPQRRGRPELAGKYSKFSFVSPPNRSSKAPGTRQNCKGDLRRVAAIEVRGIHHRAILSFHVSNQVENFGISQNTGETLLNFRQKSKEILKRY